MQNDLYVSLSAQISLERRLETIAANVANANTPGYRVDGVSFSTELAKAGDARIAFVDAGKDYISRRAGPLINTGNPLDIAVHGDGWIAVQSGGQTVYTRDGRMKMDENGGLISMTDAPVLDAAGAPIQLDPGGGPPAIARDGMISQNGRQVGAVGLFSLDADAKLTRAGTSGFTSDRGGQPILEFRSDGVEQGYIEGANVDPVREMTRLIEVSRTFDGVTNGVNQTESSLQDAIKTLGLGGMTGKTEAREGGRGPPTALDRLEGLLSRGARLAPRVSVGGVVTEIATSHFRVAGLSRFVRMGEIVRLGHAERAGIGEVVRIDDTAITVKPFDARCDAGIGARAYRAESLTLWPDESWKGRVVDALGRPLDDGGALNPGERAMALDAEPPPALKRARVREPIKSGIRVIDLFTPLSAGQRIGVFSGSGVGKSSLLAMLARAPDFDAVVIALVGERGREVREFLDDTLGDNRHNTVAVVSTGDESPMMRRLAPKTAMTIAEYFRDRGQSVLLIIDSVTRFAHAARDVALAAGEPAVARGYAPSVFSELPRLLERAGPGAEGSGAITGVFSVLVDGDDHNDPVADNIRGTLDGHIVLDRAIADQGRYPAVNVLSSISRIPHPKWTPEQRALVTRLRGLIGRYEETRELRLMGGYSAGADPVLDQAVKTVPRIYEAMTQSLASPLSDDPFVDLATALRGASKPEEAVGG